MKTASFGWEANSLQNVSVEWQVPVNGPITILGYQFFLSMESLAAPRFFGDAPFAQVLFQAHVLPPWQNNTDFGAPTLQRVGGTNDPGISGAGTMAASCFAIAILKGWEPGAVNENLVMPPILNIPCPQGIMLYAGHSGYRQDFECQGILFYE